MEFQVTAAQRDLQERARSLAADFATRAAQHDREASDPVENYAALRDAGFYALNVPAELGGGGVGLLGWSLAAEELAQGCASTALAFNMHLSVVGPMMESPIVPPATKERLAKMVVAEGKLIGGNFSEPTTSGLVATPVPAHPGPPRRRRLSRHRPQGLRVDDRRRRLRDGTGPTRRGRRRRRRPCSCWCRPTRRGVASTACGTRWGCAPRAATP